MTAVARERFSGEITQVTGNEYRFAIPQSSAISDSFAVFAIVQHTTRVVGERKKLMGKPAEALNIAQAPERESQRRACMRGKIFEPFHTIGMRSKKSKAQRV